MAAQANAQDPRSDEAKVQYLKGQTAYDLGKFREALRRFEAAYELKPVPALLFNIGQCHRKLGDLQQAANLYRSFLRADPGSTQAEQAESLLAQVELALAQREPFSLGDPVPQQPVAGDSQAGLAATARPDPQRAPSAAVAEEVPFARERKRWPAAVAGGTAVALLASGIVEALASRSATHQLEQLHQQPTVDPVRDQQLRDDANAKASRSKLLYIASGVAAAASVALWFAF